MAKFLLMACLLGLLTLAAICRVADSQSMEASRIGHSANKPGPKIRITPQEPTFIVEAGAPSTRSLTCRPEGDTPGMFSQLQWSGPNRSDNSEELRNSKRHRIVEEGNNAWELEFTNPTVDDSGIYYCQGTYQYGDAYNASILVKVYNPIKLERCPERQFLVQGRSSHSNKITCHIIGDQPRVTILKDNKTIDQYGNRYKWDNDDGLIINGDVNQSDAGEYVIKVKAETTGDKKHQSIFVQVHSMPEIAPFNGSESDAEFHGVEGDQAKLKCKVSGNPRPLVLWYDPRLRNLTHEGGYIVSPEEGTLLIKKVNKVDDHGQFICSAYNTVGSISRNVSMAVFTRPLITYFQNVTENENMDVTFECRASGDPRPDFSIRRQGVNQQPYRKGDGIVKDEDITEEGGGSNIHVYRLKIVATRASAGIHYCNATNRAGSAEGLAHLSVNFKPDLSQTPPEQYVKMGKNVTVTCHVRAYPTPTVSWWTDNAQVIDAAASSMTSKDGQTHIVTMQPRDTRLSFNKFICRAANTMGFSEQAIVPRYTTVPGPVTANLVERTPTTVKLQLSVLNDGGDRIKQFKYKLDGRTLDIHHPTWTYHLDHKNESYIDASPIPQSTYTIRNLQAYYSYKLFIRAVNDVGEGDTTDVSFETNKPTRPEPPVIVKTSTSFALHSTPGIHSEYNNGYLLTWNPPDLDNGGPIEKYIIQYNKIDSNALDITTDVGEKMTFDQMNERPMHAKLGPLEAGQRYKVGLTARNRYGDSEPTYIIVFTSTDRPTMPEFEPQSLPWLMAPSTPTLLVLISAAVFLLIVIDLVFYFCFQMGVTHKMASQWCSSDQQISHIS